MDRTLMQTAVLNRWQNECAALHPNLQADLAGMAVDAILTVASPNEHPLLTAYHAIYNVKDEQPRGGHVFVECHNTLKSLAEVMRQVDVPVPDRYDRERA
jgi:hypothetical protein